MVPEEAKLSIKAQFEPMKVLLVLIVLGAGAYYFYDRSVDAANPESITSPVYAEIRVDAAIGGRELNMAMFGAMASGEDCRERAMRVWAIWDNTGTLHRAIPYPFDCGRMLHRTKLQGEEPLQ